MGARAQVFRCKENESVLLFSDPLSAALVRKVLPNLSLTAASSPLTAVSPSPIASLPIVIHEREV